MDNLSKSKAILQQKFGWTKERSDNLFKTCEDPDHVKMCHDYDRQKTESMIKDRKEKSHVPKYFKNVSFENYDTNFHPQQKKILQATIEMLEEIENKGSNFILCGDIGGGKTHTGCTIINEWNEKKLDKKFAYYISSKELTDASTNKDYKKASECDAVCEKSLHAGLLVIDELGRDDNPGAYFDVINYRHINKLPTIFISNFSYEELCKRLGNAAVDRITARCKLINFDFGSVRSEYN